MYAGFFKNRGVGARLRGGVAALALGCAIAPGFVAAAHAAGAMPGSPQTPSKKIEKQVAASEKAVLKAPQDPATRARLGQSYLAAGRFVSAGTSFEDAVALGDKTPSTALGMALSYIAAGRNAEAAALLAQWGGTIPASDYGLALALAGQPTQAISIMGDAIKQGDNTPKMRQNLAYAYALAGHLPEARAVAAQDLPADKLEVRVSEWALQASVGSSQSRIAALLGAPVRGDQGRPAALALPRPIAASGLAQAEPAPPAPAYDSELPPVASPMAFVAATAEQPMAATVRMAHDESVSTPVQTYAHPAVMADAAMPAESGARRYVASPTADVIAARVARRRRPEGVAKPVADRNKGVPRAPRGEGSHVVQLGSFSTQEGAHRAWGLFVKRDPTLKSRQLVITEAMVNGRRYFRVAAAGFQAAEARSKCFSVKGRGGECLAYAAPAASRGRMPGRSGARQFASR